MTEKVCSYPGDRDEALVTYLYDGGDADASRAMFEAHLMTCAQCSEDLAALRSVRTQLGRWHPIDSIEWRDHYRQSDRHQCDRQLRRRIDVQ